jgi:hypothetical protein
MKFRFNERSRVDRLQTLDIVSKELVIIETKSEVENNDSNSRNPFFNFKSLIRNSPKLSLSIIPIYFYEMNEILVNLKSNFKVIHRFKQNMKNKRFLLNLVINYTKYIQNVIK